MCLVTHAVDLAAMAKYRDIFFYIKKLIARFAQGDQ
jgi:hypothetical protein